MVAGVALAVVVAVVVEAVETALGVMVSVVGLDRESGSCSPRCRRHLPHSSRSPVGT